MDHIFYKVSASHVQRKTFLIISSTALDTGPNRSPTPDKTQGLHLPRQNQVGTVANCGRMTRSWSYQLPGRTLAQNNVSNRDVGMYQSWKTKANEMKIRKSKWQCTVASNGQKHLLDPFGMNLRPRRLRTAITLMTCSCPHGICRSLTCVHQPKTTFPWGLTDFQSLFCLFTTAKHLFFIFNHEFSDCNNLRSCSWCPPTNLVIESLGLRLLGTHPGPPRQTASDSRMMAVSNALLSSPWLCSEFRASKRLFASMTQMLCGSRYWMESLAMTVAFPQASRYWSSFCCFIRGLKPDWLMLCEKASSLSKAPVAADIEIASHSSDDEAFHLRRLERHCINDIGDSFPLFIKGCVNPRIHPCCDFSFPLVSKAESAIKISRRWSSGSAWILKMNGNDFRCFTTSFAACTCSIGNDDARIDGRGSVRSTDPPLTPSWVRRWGPKSCVFSLSFNGVWAACFFSTFLWLNIGSNLV